VIPLSVDFFYSLFIYLCILGIFSAHAKKNPKKRGLIIHVAIPWVFGVLSGPKIRAKQHHNSQTLIAPAMLATFSVICDRTFRIIAITTFPFLDYHKPANLQGKLLKI
jgi:predicted branched-subunit amino acid permease